MVDLGEDAVRHATVELPPIEREREVYDALVMGLRDYMRKSHFTDTVVPVSGGIDSALVLAIAVDAVGPGHVRAYNLPSQYNSDTTRSIAERLSCALGVRYGVIPISSIDEDVRATFERHAHPDRALAHPRESPRPHSRAADDGGIERHRCAAAVVRERDRNRARLRDALRRHVRRHLGDWRSVQGRRLPPGSPRQRPPRARDHSGRDLHPQAVGRARAPDRSTPSTTT